MSDLPIELYNVKQVRALERAAIQHFSLPEAMLMERAGRAAFDALQEHFPDVESVTVICGSGNNAGDGYVLARLALQHELAVTIYAIGKQSKLGPAALAAAKTCRALGITIKPFTPDCELDGDVIIDAVLGIGIEGEVHGDVKAAILAMNAASRPVLSIDVPSGINADTGAICGEAVMAAVTVTFIGMKQGLLTGAARECCGELVFDDLNLPLKLYKDTPITALRIDSSEIEALLPDRKRDAHKGDFGHVLVIGGDYGTAGAVRMAAEAALRAGAGAVSVATRPEHVTAIVSARPEIMCLGVKSAAELTQLLEKATVIVLGPGLGESSWSKELFKAALKTKLPMIIDAEGLRLLAKSPIKRDNWVLTPHPGEAASLLATKTATIQADRFQSVVDLQSQYGGVVVLKGAGTLIQSGQDVCEICTAGNPGMATAGMGDILTGVIAGLLAQGFSLQEAARIGVWAHAYAGDCVATDTGERGILAMDLLPHIQLAINNMAEDQDDDLFLEDEFGMLGDLVPSANDEED